MTLMGARHTIRSDSATQGNFLRHVIHQTVLFEASRCRMIYWHACKFVSWKPVLKIHPPFGDTDQCHTMLYGPVDPKFGFQALFRAR